MASVSRQIGWSQESNLLWQILNQITKLTNTKASDISQCKVIAMGRRGCGGVNKYIVYSTENTNVLLLKSFISVRDIISYPERFMPSICSIEIKPSSFKIIEGECKGVSY
jgi:hypothetical protein